jgi:lipopolysaccharide export system protein LptA
MPHDVAPRHALTWLLIAAALLASPLAEARKSDRNQAMDVTAGKQEGGLGDDTPTVLSGGVTIDQGTLHAEASRAEISTRGGEIARVVLSGGPARLNQELDDGSPMSAVAEKVDYNPNTEMVVFTGNVTIKQPRGSLSGERVVYNMASGQVTSGGEGAGRVRMRILPKGGGNSAPPAPANAEGAGEAGDSPAEDG